MFKTVSRCILAFRRPQPVPPTVTQADLQALLHELSALISRIETAMTTASDALIAAKAALLAKVTVLDDRAAAVEAVVTGIPALVNAAVAKALADAQASNPSLDDATIQSIADDINGAVERISTDSDGIMTAISANTPPAPPVGGDTGAGTVAGAGDDTISGATGGDSVSTGTGDDTTLGGQGAGSVSGDQGGDSIQG